MGKKSRKKNKTTITTASASAIVKEKTQLERMVIVQEVENKLIEHRIEHEIASKVLKRIMDDYVINGTKYIGKELRLNLVQDIPRKFVINLFNQADLRDQVVIKAQ